ncbi:MAG: DUF4132 domain-containing protein [Armatimonadetes bacterium]|nr:DUF4132 domain-containing protein [Armatimonadota bacterium]
MTRRYIDAGGTLTIPMQMMLRQARAGVAAYKSKEIGKIRTLLGELLGDSDTHLPDSGEPWADAALAEWNAMPPEAQMAWSALFSHAATAEGGKPTAKWQAQAEKNRQAVGENEFTRRAAAWLAKGTPPSPFTEAAPQMPHADNPTRGFYKSQEYLDYQKANGEYYLRVREYLKRISEKNITILKGLAWYAAASDDAELARALGHLTEAAFSHVRERGAWAKSAGNAAIWALGQMPEGVGVGPLARLRTRLRDRGALKLIEAAIASAARTAGMSVDELEDLAVPTAGLDADGKRREAFGEDGAATLTLDPKTGKTNLQWFGPDGKERKAVPAAIKKNWAAEVKALKAAEEEIKQALTAQAARFDKFLLDEREWPLAVWHERYLAHPVLGNLARRLIWTIDGVPTLPNDSHTQICQNEPAPDTPNPLPSEGEGGEPERAGRGGTGEVASLGEPEGVLPPQGAVRLWHPLGATPDDVLRWRQTLEDRGIVQPFKQAHREVYLLTDAERRTRTYSNRFAAHILKQHQFNSLCVLRGWKNKLRLMVDDSYPPATRELPQPNLRAEFWVEGIGDDYGTDTNEAGTYLRLATDQVRFYRLDAPTNYAHAGGGGYGANWRQAPAEPLPLEEVPPLVLSEIMRDVDLFVGVASVGNDPAWADGGPQGRFRNYWQEYAFGDLTESAKTRADVLARLLPRLKIAGRCRLDGRFLFVRGDLRTYKIHLGSGNILMEPNDQYLCIVPNSRAEEGDNLFLPFEGDRTLAVILSKAFLLAADTRVADPTITRQIKT